MANKKTKELIIAILLISASLIICFVIAEIFIRLFFPQRTGPMMFAWQEELGPIPVPEQNAWFFVPGVGYYHVINNSIGLRASKEFSKQKTKKRLLFLGDSFTYGMGVSNNETFPYLVEQLLQAEGKNMEVINAGNPSKGTDYALKFYTYFGKKFQPDIVCLCFFPNDFSDNALGMYYKLINGKLIETEQKNSFTAKKDFLRKFKLYNWLISWSHCINLLKKAFIRLIILLKKKQSSKGLIRHYGTGYKTYSNNKNIKITEKVIEILNKEVIKSNAKLIIFYLPSIIDLKSDKILKDEKALSKIASKLKIPYYSLTNYLKSKNVKKIYLKEGHFSKVGNKFVAEFIVNILVSKFL